tara:strand:- start:2129 stop:2470 length:342 start_codon:yes stop_codon:yes gene_type:complete
MSDDVKDIVDLAMDDKPNKAAEVLDVVLRDRLADKVDGLKNELSNGMFGQEYQPDAEPVEVQTELDLEPAEQEDFADEDQNDYEAEQELVAEPEAEGEQEQPDQEEDLDETEE